MAGEGKSLLAEQMLGVVHQDRQVQIGELVVVIPIMPRLPMKTFVRWLVVARVVRRRCFHFHFHFHCYYQFH